MSASLVGSEMCIRDRGSIMAGRSSGDHVEGRIAPSGGHTGRGAATARLGRRTAAARKQRRRVEAEGGGAGPRARGS
eukprot:14718081-Alexandrium_andersonii.AAC.1